MVYRITVDGKRKYAEAAIKEYSLEADNKARERIIHRFLDEEGASEVTFDTTLDETRELHKVAGEFYQQLTEFREVWEGLQRERKWDTDEMALLIPQLMKVYMLAMKLPRLEYMEDANFETSKMFHCGRVNFAKNYDTYWQVFDPYCKEDLYHGNANDKDGEICRGMLSDDIADILTGLSKGAGAYETGLVCEAIFCWRFNLIGHYGHHIRNAINAMGAAWEGAVADKDMDIKPEDYWCYED